MRELKNFETFVNGDQYVQPLFSIYKNKAIMRDTLEQDIDLKIFKNYEKYYNQRSVDYQ